MRAEWFERQKQLGIVPPDAQLAPRNPDVDAWDTLDADQRRLYARMQEAFAGFLDHTDAQVGRLMEFLKRVDALDNTLVVFLSDNGASQEGGRDGMLNELAYFNRLSEPVSDMIGRIDAIGGPHLYNNYPRGWAQVGNTPLRFYKQNTHEGGIRDPLIVSWPARIKPASQGGIRTQYHHVIDIFPTILECVGVTAPEVYKGVPQLPVEGLSLAYSFDANPPQSRRRTQYYEMLGHRAIWADGWKAVTRHKQGEPFDSDRWMLYDTEHDFAECHDLADQQPQKLQQMIATWWTEAGRYNVLPLDDRGVELFTLRRPQPGGPRLQLRFLPGTPHIDRFAVPDIRNRSFAISASFNRDSVARQGALVACGGRTGGHALYIQGNHACFSYNRIGQVRTLRSASPLPAGPCTVLLRFTKTAEHEGRAELLVDGQPAGEMAIALMPWRQSVFGMDIGADHGSTVSPDYDAPFAFEGQLEHVDYTLGTDRADLQKAAAVEARNALVDQ